MQAVRFLAQLQLVTHSLKEGSAGLYQSRKCTSAVLNAREGPERASR